MPTTTQYTNYPQFANATVTVTTSAELNAALVSLGSSGGGTILVDPNGGPYDIFANGVGDANNPILIQGMDPANPPLVENIYLLNTGYITMTGLHVDSSASPTGVQDLRISNGDHIEFVGNTMTSTANGYLDGTGSATQGANAVLVRDSNDIVFSNNTLANYYHGAGFLEVSGLTFSGNEMFGLQGDGFRAGGIENVQITNNYMHDFFGSAQSINHSDFIQIWSTNANITTSNVEISGNILDTGGNAIYQGIFIGNEQMRGNGTGGNYYDDIRIHDNVIHTATWHGIAIEFTTNADIYNNAVMLDDQVPIPSGSQQPIPWIRATASPGASVYGNLAWRVTVNGTDDNGTQNQLLDYNDPATAGFIDNYMASLGTWSGTNPPLTGGWTGSGTGGSTSTGTSGGTDTSGSGSTDTSGSGSTDTSGSSSTDTSAGTDTSTGSDTPGGTDTSDGTETSGGATNSPSGEAEGIGNSGQGAANSNGPAEGAKIMSAYTKAVASVAAKFNLAPNTLSNSDTVAAPPQPGPTQDDVNNLFLPETETNGTTVSEDDETLEETTLLALV